MEIDYKKLTNDCIDWIRNWFEFNGKNCNAILGLSGGKDSTIIAALCVAALGKDRVIGVAMPQGNQGLNGADEIAKYLGIKLKTVNIGETVDVLKNSLGYGVLPGYSLSKQAEQNIPPRIRMAVLYAIAQTENGRVAYCDNASERYIGYFTKWGDGVGDFGPIANLTVTEVLAIGDYLGLPYEWVHKTPSDGLPHSQDDEDKIGFTYKILDEFIRTGLCYDNEILDKIVTRHNKNVFKVKSINIPTFDPGFKTIDDNGNNSL